MAIFTPNSKFLKMMKTTLNTNKYFIENGDNMVDYDYNKDTKIETATATIDTAKYELKDNVEDYVIDKTDEVRKEYQDFAEQQIKLNKQTKYNYDRLTKKITIAYKDTYELLNKNNRKIIDNNVKTGTILEIANRLETDARSSIEEKIKELKNAIYWLIIINIIQVFFIIYYFMIHILGG